MFEGTPTRVFELEEAADSHNWSWAVLAVGMVPPLLMKLVRRGAVELSEGRAGLS